MAKQPFYHRGDVMFSASKALDEGAFLACLKTALSNISGYVKHSAMIEFSAKPKKKAGAIMHCFTVLFTATRDIETQAFKTEMAREISRNSIVDAESLRIASYDAEPGDPMDL